MANWTYNPNDYQEKDFTLIPEGNHRVRINQVTEKVFKSGNEGFEIVLDVSGQSGKLWYYLVLNRANEQQTNQNIGAFFNCFGITTPQLGNGQQWVGKSGAVRVKHEDYNGSKSAKVQYLLNRSKQDELPQWQGNASTAHSQPQTEFTQVNPDDLPF